LKVLVAGFMTIDTIQLPVRTITSVGGPPCYAGLVCARFGMDVDVITKVGPDFPDDQSVWLARNGIRLTPQDRSANVKTTRFKIAAKGQDRKLVLEQRCEDLSSGQLTQTRYNAALVSPLAGEISASLLADIAKQSDFTFMDPQGFVRVFDSEGAVSVSRIKDEGILKSVDAVKMDMEEAEAITGKSSPTDALSKLSNFGVRKALLTRGGETCLVMDGPRFFSVPVPKVQVVDTTGAGDVLAGATISTYIRSRDFLWSACFGVAASSLSLHMIALSKVDLPMSVDEQARRLYSTASPIAPA